MSEKKVVIGVDVGGTKIRAGALTLDGKSIGQSYTVPTGGQDSKENIVGRIVDSIRHVMEDCDLSGDFVLGIGMGVTGPIDIQKGIILECPQLPTLHFYPLKDKILDSFRLPVIMNNDANALVLGESIWGAGQGYNSVLGFTLGTGLGCAFVINGKLHLGATEMSGEIWPSPYKDRTIEDYVSGRGISQIYAGLSGEDKSALEIATLARKGDKNALATWDEFGKGLGFALSWTVNMVDPDIVVLGGSIANAFDIFEKPLNTYFRKYICPDPAQKTRVVKATLGDDAGVLGSGALVLQGV